VPRLLGAKSRGLNRTGHPLGWGLLTLGALDRGVLRVPFRAARLRRWGTSERFSAGFVQRRVLGYVVMFRQLLK